MERAPLKHLARVSYRRRRAVVVGWIGLVVGLSVFNATFGGELRNAVSNAGAESEEATDLLEEGGLGRRGGHVGQIVFGAEDGVDDPDVRAAMEGFFADVRAEVPEVGILSPYDEAGRAQVAPDGSVAFAELQFGDVDRDDANDLADQIVDVRADADLAEGLQVELGGELFFEEVEFSSEGVGFLAAMVILLIAFGSVLAMGLPLITAVFGIVAGIALVMLVANAIDVPDFGPQAVMLIAIGVGIDYALLIVTRFREELRNPQQEPEGAVVVAMATAGRSVVFAGTTVIIALLGLMLSSLSVFRSLAIATSLGVLMVMLATLTLVPALLGFAGRNIDRLSVHRRDRKAKELQATVWYRWSRLVQRRPGPVALVAVAVLLALAAPLLAMRLGLSDAGNRPESDTSRRAYDLVSEGFGPGHNGPLFLAADLSGDAAENATVLERLEGALNADEGVAVALPPATSEAGDVGFMQLFPTTSPQDADTADTVNRLRDEVIPRAVEGSSVEVMVGGAPAAAVDFGDIQSSQLPVFIAAVLGLTFVLLMAVFRSVAVALKAVVMNMLSIGAAYGAIVAVFQWGWGSGVLGIEPGPIEVWAPMMLFAITFGLSIDYEVFLLSRIKEERDRRVHTIAGEAVLPENGGRRGGALGSGVAPAALHGPGATSEAITGRRRAGALGLAALGLAARPAPVDGHGATSEAIADGLAKTARVITAAAAIMVSVAAGFVLSDERGVALFGLGLAVAIFVDAAIVRTLLVPAAMELMGEANWWMPRWLARILPHIDVDGSARRAPVPAPAAHTGNGDDDRSRPTEPSVPTGV